MDLSGAGELEPMALAWGLLGGLALFLFGLDQMSYALKSVAGERMKQILGRFTSNRVVGAVTGAFVTAVIQSSSVTTVLVVGFISAGLMTLTQSVGVIMGANIGASFTAQVIAFEVTRYALPMIAVGFAMQFLGQHERVRQYGKMLMGLGLLFFGMAVMGDAMRPLRASPLFLDWMARLETPLLGIFVGAVFTALIQASGATAGIVIVFAAEGLIGLPAGIAVIFGANIGTCVTALFASIGRPREARRAAWIHVLFNVLGVLIWLPWIDHLAGFVESMSPRNAPRQVANAHTLFNVANTLVFLPFAGLLIKIVERAVPDGPPREERVRRAKYLDRDLLGTPALALDRARLEILHMGDQALEMLRRIRPALIDGSRKELESIAALDDDVDALHGQIVTFLGKVSQTELTEAQTLEFLKLLETTNDLENIGDIIETNLVALGNQRIDSGVRVSDSTRQVIDEFHRAVERSLESALLAVTQKNEAAARQVVEMKREINRMAGSAARHEARRLVAAEPNRLPAYTVESDILQNLKRIYYFCKRMARAVIPAEITAVEDEV
jgi:phosphate:Na+ symporter